MQIPGWTWSQDMGFVHVYTNAYAAILNLKVLLIVMFIQLYCWITTMKFKIQKYINTMLSSNLWWYEACLSGSQSVQGFNHLFIHVLPLEIQLSKRELSGLTFSRFLCIFQVRTWISNVSRLWSFLCAISEGDCSFCWWNSLSLLFKYSLHKQTTSIVFFIHRRFVYDI